MNHPKFEGTINLYKINLLAPVQHLGCLMFRLELMLIATATISLAITTGKEFTHHSVFIKMGNIL
ncbi:MAG: hypothetical protein ACKVOK_00835 [Flavobacteriales bacterium]